MLKFKHKSPVTAAEPDASLEPNNIQSRFGRRLRALRLERGWTQGKMAVDLGLDRGHICDLERGKKTITLRTLEVFAVGLKVDLSELLQGV